ncbi:MAG: gamma-mobile-trio protein GmtX, partial [Parachlamydiaceae bacterium]
CKEQLEMGGKDFSFSTIAKLGAKRGVPMAQSMRNKTGESYRILINSFVKSSNEKSSGKTLKDNSAKDDWIECIKDPNLKLRVRKLAVDLKNAQKQNKEMMPINGVIEINDFPVKKENVSLSNFEREALEYILSPEFLEKGQLTVEKQGHMIAANGRVVFKVATVDAIKKALEFL